MTNQEKWDRRFLALAEHVAQWSKDPSTRTGAVIVDNNNRVISLGYNGFAKGVKDDPAHYSNRDIKYLKVVHCEVNAILFAKQSVQGFSLFTWPFMSCSRCAAIVTQSGIRRVVAPAMSDDIASRWATDVALAKQQFEEAGVEVVIYDTAKHDM